MAALRLAYSMAEPRARDESPARFRRRAEEHTDALIDAFARVLEGVNELDPNPATKELWQRSVGRVLANRSWCPTDTDTRLRIGYEVTLQALDEALLRVVLAAHDPRLRNVLQRQDRILIQDGTTDWLRTLDWHEVRERGDEAVADRSLADERRGNAKSKQLVHEEIGQEIHGVRAASTRGWWRLPCRAHKIKGCSQCIRRKRGRPKKTGSTDPDTRFNELAHAAGYGPDVFKRPAKPGRPSRSEAERLDMLASAVVVLYDEGHSLEAIGALIGGGRQRAHELFHRAKRAA